MAKSKKNKNKPKLNLTARDEQRQSKNGVVKILSFSFWQAFCSAIHLATMRDRDQRRFSRETKPAFSNCVCNRH
jgi:hypothetical protein